MTHDRAPRRPLPAGSGRASAWMWAPAVAAPLLFGGGCALGVDGATEVILHADEVGRVDPLAAYLTREAPTSEAEAALLARLEVGILEWRDGDPARGAAMADSALALLPTLGDWLPLLRAELLLPTGDTAGIRAALAALDPDTEFASRWGWRVQVDALLAARDSAGARRAAREAGERETDSARRAEMWLQAGRLSLALGDSTAAREELWRAVELGARFAGAQGAARLLDPLPGALPPDQELRLGRALLAGGNWDRAYRRLVPHLATGAVSPTEEEGELRLDVARALFELRRHAEIPAVLAPLLEAGAPPASHIEALYWSGRSALESGVPARAEERFRALATVAPESGRAAEGITLLLARELQTGFGPRARSLVDDLFRIGVRGTAGEALLVELGTRRYLEGDAAGAAALFDGYFAASERAAARQQAGYWAALSHERAGGGTRSADLLAEVHAADPFATYGVFAGERVGAPVLPPGLAEGPAPVPGLEVELRNALLRLRVHRLVPTPGSFAHEMERLTAHFLRRGDGGYDFAEAMIEGGFPLEAIVLGREIRRIEGDWNLRLLRIVHPLPHRESLLREAQARGLDPFFVAGVIRQESAWDHRIVSGSGAVGLMQLLPGTAREVAGSLGIRFSPEILTDPETNLRLGTTYLSQMLSRFDGRAEDALAAYNAGPSRIRQWRETPVYRDRDVFMEHIPFQETRNYVKVVQQYARIYAALYGCEDFSPCMGLSYGEVVARSPLASGRPGLPVAR